MLSLIHLTTLLACALYLSLAHPGTALCAVVMLSAAMLAELLPGWLRRGLAPELLVLLALVVGRSGGLPG